MLRFFGGLQRSRRPLVSRDSAADSVASVKASAASQWPGLELLEGRQLLNADPIWLGAVFYETDDGSDADPDQFYISFNGGAPGTQLTRLVINTDLYEPGYSRGDLFFDTAPGGLGTDLWHPFQVIELVTANPLATVRAEVEDGGMELVLYFEHFTAGDILVFGIDVDELQHFKPGETDSDRINAGVDPIVSGIEVQASRLQGTFTAAHFHEITTEGEFRNLFSDARDESQLDLPGDDAGPRRDRQAGVFFQVDQQPLPVSLEGLVFVDNNLNLQPEPEELPLADVQLDLYRLDGDEYVFTGHSTVTDSGGQYRFGSELGLMPGTYQVRQHQPEGYFSVGATPGILAGDVAGQTVAGDTNIITHITIPLGGLHVIEVNFAESLGAEISGYVYQDLNDNGLREPGEAGIGQVRIDLIPIDTIAPQDPLSVWTDADGFYSFVGLAPGLYRVEQPTQPEGFFDGQDTPGVVAGETVGIADPPDALAGIVLLGGQVGTEYNFGEITPASLGGTMFLAMPGFTCFDDEPGSSTPLVGARIDLYDGDGQLVASTLSDAQGHYRFDGLRPGTYRLVQFTPDAYLDGSARLGQVGGQPSGRVIGGGEIIGIELRPGSQALSYDFCELQPSSLSGYVFEDLNDDAQRQSVEPPIANVQLQLWDAGGRLVAETWTAEDGSYRFDRLYPGEYRITQVQPSGYIDGQNAAGTINGVVVGVAPRELDEISGVALASGQAGIEYNFGELRPATISGRVMADTNGNCIIDAPGDHPIAGVVMELLGPDDQLLQQVLTDADGNYRFEGLLPGVYSIRQQQPEGYFDGPHRAGQAGGDVSEQHLIRGIPVLSGGWLTGYDFCEAPPASLSGYVFQDGAPLVTPDGLPPENLAELRPGVRGSDSVPLAGVLLELRDADGRPFEYRPGLVGYSAEYEYRTWTDSRGFYEFTGLPPGVYHVYQVQPSGWVDGVDTPGSAGGFALNPHQFPLSAEQQQLIDRLAGDPATDPGFDGLMQIQLMAGQVSVENNFSEVMVLVAPTPPEPPVPPQPPEPPIPPVGGRSLMGPIEQTGWGPGLPVAELIRPDSLAAGAPLPLLIGGGPSLPFTWHLSVINAGWPRGDRADLVLSQDQLAEASYLLDIPRWTVQGLDQGQWRIISTEPGVAPSDARAAFNIEGATALAGDFNGDGRDQLALFYRGEWLIDINGNGVWDDQDLWVRLGAEDDLPVVGDWDGDGKDDIGIFGPAWSSDLGRIPNESGLPSLENQRLTNPKNMPPELARQAELHETRMLVRTAQGVGRADVIDHVFGLGLARDLPVAGDFNGDGISTIGVFRDGRWIIDIDGDGQLTDRDVQTVFGQPGDVPVVGDFDGLGIDQIAVLRGNRLIVDANRNFQLDAADQFIEVDAEAGQVVIGDFDGDGIEEPAVHRGGAALEGLLEARRRDGSLL